MKIELAWLCVYLVSTALGVTSFTYTSILPIGFHWAAQKQVRDTVSNP